MTAKKRFESDALQGLYAKIVGNDSKKKAEFDQHYEDAVIQTDAAQLIYDIRSKAGLSQRELAKKVGTTASVICRLEDADYEGHTLAMVRRIAAALDRRLELRAVPIRPRTRKIAKASER